MKDKTRNLIVSILLIVIILVGIAIHVAFWINPPLMTLMLPVIDLFNFMLFCQLVILILPFILLLILHIEQIKLETRYQIGRTVSLISIFIIVFNISVVIWFDISTDWILNYLLGITLGLPLAIALLSYIGIYFLFWTKKEA